MQGPSIVWWLIVIVAAAVIVWAASRAMARSRQRRETERLAQPADAAHEGARTRHEGGA